MCCVLRVAGVQHATRRELFAAPDPVLLARKSGARMAQPIGMARQEKGVSGKGRLLSWRRRRLIVAFLFVLPALINFAVFRYIPIVESFAASLYKYSLLGGFGDFVGAQNYTCMLTDPVFWRSMQATVL